MLFGSSLRPGEICDYTVAKSGTQEPLLDTAAEHTMKYWSAYCHDGDGRWCYDGYYFPSEANYIPTGENCRYLCMASYLTKSMTWQADTVRMADNFLLVMLDTISLQQNEDGYFPTQPGCQWLIDDYGIPAGFYDTRFNSDLMLIYYEQVRRDGGFEQTLSRYFDFYLDFAENHHYETENGGYLVWDYNHSTVPVHSSLNHQLTEMLVLYRFAEHLDRPELEELADRMLLGIEDTCEGWIKEDGNLHYCYMDGDTFGKEDYDYLTYNDLFTMQKELQSMGRERNEALDQLMEAKLSWMQANGITGYLQ